MTWLQAFFEEMGFLLGEAAPYLIVGFFLAGLMKVYLPRSKVFEQLGKPNLRSSVLASLYGMPLPLCSCSVIPTAAELKKAGASKGATASFLISTPETGVDSIGVTYALMDPLMTVARPVTAFFTAVTTGGIVNLFSRRGWDDEPADADAALAELEAREHEGHDHGPTDGDCDDGREEAAEPPAATHGARFKEAARYAFGPLLDDLVPWLVLGLLASGVLATMMPDNLFTEIVPRGWPALLLMLAIGTPLYICATASTPIAVTLIAKGMEPGAALVFLLVGPATNLTTLLVVAKLLGRRVLVTYLVSITSVALVAGLVINGIYERLGLDLAATVAEASAEEAGLVTWVSGIALVLLMIASARRIDLLGRWGGDLHRLGRPIGVDPTARGWRVAAALALLGLWGSTAVSVVRPGESGWVLRFGRIVRALEEPGIYVHAPVPFDRVELARPEQLRSVRNGLMPELPPSGAAQYRAAVEAQETMRSELEMMTGDENLLSISYAVHFALRDARRATFGVTDVDALVFALSEGALRQVIGRRATSEILIEDRRAIEAEARAVLQAELDAAGSGALAVAVLLHDVHAPPNVHQAYRDVASALEDQVKYRHEAESDVIRTLSEARAEAHQTRNAARGAALARTEAARGEAKAFEAFARAFRAHPELSQLRMRLEALKSSLSQTRNVLPLGEGIEVEVYDFGEGSAATRSAVGGSDR